MIAIKFITILFIGTIICALVDLHGARLLKDSRATKAEGR